MRHNQKSILADVALLLVAIIWGSGFIATKFALDADISPFYMMTFRFTIASLILCIVFIRKLKKMNKSVIRSGIIIGIFLFGGFAMQTIGLQYTTPSKNAFLTAVNVVIVPFLYWMVSRKKPDNYAVGAAVLCFLGIGFLTVEAGFAINIGDALTLVCAVFFACHIVSVGYFAKEMDPISLTIVQMITAAVLSGICAVFFEQQPKIWGVKGMLAVGYLGIFSTFIAFLIQNTAQKHTTATKTAILLSTESVFGTLFSITLLKEQLTYKMLIGCFVIFAAIIISETKLSFLKTAPVVKDGSKAGV
ncbi:MAG: DMT family transporter [Firmicutes bacterium]|nr:DMT family transporter [Bacillota bacterium]